MPWEEGGAAMCRIISAGQKSCAVLGHELVIGAICLERLHRRHKCGSLRRRESRLIFADTHVIETQGTTDVVMGLYGPNDMATLIVENDDGGVQGNSRISRNLSLGTYYVRVRHYTSTSTGNYSIGVQQPAAQPDIPIIQVNGLPLEGSIDVANERDLYTFTAPVSGTYTIETAGSTDCFLTLFGPGNADTFIAEDDDSGPAANSRIVVNLESGSYFVQVRHYSSTATGPYSILVRR